MRGPGGYVLGPVLATVALATVATFNGHAVSSAATTPGMDIAVSPRQRTATGMKTVSYLSFRIRPGESARGYVDIASRGSKTASVDIDPVDAETADNFGYAYKSSGTETHGSTTWISVESGVGIPAGAKKRVAVDVTVPSTARPGDYLSGLGIETSDAVSSKVARNGFIGQRRRFAIGVHVRVPGAAKPYVRLDQASGRQLPGGMVFTVDAFNPGSVLLRGTRAEIAVRSDGKEVTRAEIGPGTFVPGTSVELSTYAAGFRARPGQRFDVGVSLLFAGGASDMTRSLIMSGADISSGARVDSGAPRGRRMPPWVFGAAAGSVALLAGGALLWRLKRRSIRYMHVRKGMEVLDLEVENARSTGRPVSVVVCHVDSAAPRPGRTLLRALASRLRSRDSVVDLGDGWIMAIAPDTDVGMAKALSEGIAGALRDPIVGRPIVGRPIVGTATAVDPVDAEHLVQAAMESATGTMPGDLWRFPT